MRIKVKKEVADYLASAATTVVTKGNTYYYLPYWMKATPDPTVFDELSWDELPQDLKDTIQAFREIQKP